MHGTCRDPSNKKKLQHLLDLSGAETRLKLFQVLHSSHTSRPR